MSRTIKTLVLCLTAFGWGCAGDKVAAPIDDSIDPGMMGAPEVRSPDDMLPSPPVGQPEPENGFEEPVSPPPNSPPTTPPVNGDECVLDGIAGVKIVAQVSWPATLAMEAGSGTMNIWFRADLADAGDGLSASGHVCETQVPDFRTNALAGGDTHGTVIPADAWRGAPQTNLAIQLTGRTPGATIAVNATPMLLGAAMNDMTAAWPRSRRDLESADHDGDQHPGVTSYSAMGPDYANPRVDILDASQRAERIFLGLRNIIGFSGTLTSCDAAEGVASLVLEQRAFGCIREDGQNCTDGQTDLLDSNLPAFQVESATFTLERLGPNATCDDIRAQL